MIITTDKLNAFYNMIRNNVNKYSLAVSMETTDVSSKERATTVITLANSLKERRYVVRWAEVKSLTEAATPILADATVVFGFRTTEQVRDYSFDISNVIFNGPATIVMWKDGTKTVVKCQDGDCYSEETGLALCFMKKALGNKPNFNNVFRKWIPEPVSEGAFEDLIKLFLAAGMQNDI